MFLIRQELDRLSQFSGTTFDLYQTYGNHWYPDELQRCVRQILSTSSDDAVLSSSMVDELLAALQQQSRALKTVANKLESESLRASNDIEAKSLFDAKKRTFMEEVGQKKNFVKKNINIDCIYM